MFSPVEGAPLAESTPRPGLPLEPWRLVRAVRQGARRILLTMALALPLGALVALTLAPREFVAQSVLVWEPQEPSPAPARELQTLTSAVKLPGNIEQVRARLQIDDTLEEIGKRIEVDAVSNESNVLTLSGVGKSAQDAARFIQTVTDVFLEERVRIARTRAEERLKSLGEEIARVLQQVSAARERYDEFRSRNHLVDFALDRKVAMDQLSFLRTEVSKNRIEADAHAMRVQQLRAAVQKSSPQLVLTENQVQAERQKLAELNAQLTARRASLSQEHPEVLGLQASVDALEKRPADAYTVTGRQVGANPEWMHLQEELSTASIDGQAAEQKWQSYSKLHDALNERLQTLSLVEGESSLLLSDVQLAEQRLAQLKTEQNLLESSVRQPSSELRILNAPVPPPWPAHSARKKVALAFPLLAGLLATLYYLGRELRGLRLCAPTEFAFWSDAPVLASSSWPREPEELRPLALELASQGERAPGTTLVLPLSPVPGEQAAGLVEALRALLPAEAPVLGDPTATVQALRRAARESTRVLVLVQAGAHAPPALLGLRRWLGRDDGLGLVVLGLGPELALLRDRLGDVAGFWARPSSAMASAVASAMASVPAGAPGRTAP